MKRKENILLITPLLLLLTVVCTGFFAISAERQESREIGRRIVVIEKQINQLERDNAELAVKIAEQKNPSLLTRRASTRLGRPVITAVVWGYENYDGGRIDFSKRNKGLVSFKAPTKKARVRR
jgi:DNA-binding response OmpR family regulator